MAEHRINSDAVEASHDCCANLDSVRKEQLTTSAGRWVGGKKPRIELLYFDGCPTYMLARQIIAEVFKATSVSAEVWEVSVTSDARARQLRFIGSPTVRIDGRDVDPVPYGSEQYGLKCRVYSVNGKLTGCPSREMILAALKESGYVA